MKIRRIVTAIGSAILVPVLLTGCVPDFVIEDTLRTAAVEEIPHTIDADIGFNYDGLPTQRGVKLTLFMDDTSVPVVAAAIDAALELGWKRFPVEPVRVSVVVADGAPRGDDQYVKGIDLVEAGTVLGIQNNVVYELVTLRKSELEQRYGPRE